MGKIEEAKQMLSILRDNAYSVEDENRTIIEGVNFDSFDFSLELTINILDEIINNGRGNNE